MKGMLQKSNWILRSDLKKDPDLLLNLCCFPFNSRLKQWYHLRNKSINHKASVLKDIKHRPPLIAACSLSCTAPSEEGIRVEVEHVRAVGHVRHGSF